MKCSPTWDQTNASARRIQWNSSFRSIVFIALIVSRVLYALPACGGFLSSDLLNTFGYTTEVLKGTDMLQNADNKLFSLMFRSGHCLHTLLPDLKVIDIVLRNSGTNSICLTAVINCTNSRLSICLLATAIDMFCFVGHYMLYDLIWVVIFFLHIIGWRLSVSINDMLCYVTLCYDWRLFDRF